VRPPTTIAINPRFDRSLYTAEELRIIDRAVGLRIAGFHPDDAALVARLEARVRPADSDGFDLSDGSLPEALRSAGLDEEALEADDAIARAVNAA
jgi:hypothetical protein